MVTGAASIPTGRSASADHAGTARRLGWREILTTPLPHLHGRWALRLTIRTVLLLFRSRIRGIHGAERLVDADLPALFVANHSQRLEAVILPALLAFLSRGRNVHFLADWNFLVIPGLGWILSLNEPIPVVRKDLRPRFLNVLKPLYQAAVDPMTQARLRLRLHEPVGLFPEGTANRNRNAMLRGLTGGARLSLETGTTVIPVGLRFAPAPASRPISDLEAFEVHIGEPLVPPDIPAPGRRDVAAWHARLFQALSILSGKNWSPDRPRTRHETE
jgi:1-acyl-sn-glycerol-3-phosphate acyltransferase